MALKTIIDNINTKRREYEEALAQMNNNAAGQIAAELGPLVPPGYALTWTQYTPHFNDGSPCYFGVHEPYLVRDKREKDEEDESPEAQEANESGDGPDRMELGTCIDRYGKPNEAKSYQTNDYSKQISPRGEWPVKYEQKTVNYIDYGFPAIEGFSAEKLEELASLIDALPQDMLEKAFGDGVEVLIYPDGTFSNDDYSHD